jgi:hypothetical protein
LSDLLKRIQEDFKEVLSARDAWIDAQLSLARAEEELRFAQAKLAVARDQLRLHAHRTAEVAEEGQSIGSLLDDEFWPGPDDPDPETPDDLLESIAYMGMPLGDACRRALENRLGLAKAAEYTGITSEAVLSGGATTEDLVESLSRGGFTFTSDAPAREVHGALIKQPWVTREKETGRWRLLTRKRL